MADSFVRMILCGNFILHEIRYVVFIFYLCCT